MTSELPILIVEDEPSIVDVLRLALRREGLAHVVAAGTGEDAVALARSQRPALVVLDIGLPDMSGLEVAERLRNMLTDVPLLFLTARDSDSDKLAGFGAGADDYVTKPFNPLEVAARVKALLRRSAPSVQPELEYDLGRFVLYPEEARLVVGGEEVAAPARELQLLGFLAKHEGRVFSADEVYRQVWKAEPIGPSDQNTVSVHVRRLRERIEEDPANPQYLVTVRGLGYKLVRPRED
jgi:DNA-binding response OmpR family regulator